MKILGGDTVEQVCTAATKKVMAQNMQSRDPVQQQEMAAVEKPAPAATEAICKSAISSHLTPATCLKNTGHSLVRAIT